MTEATRIDNFDSLIFEVGDDSIATVHLNRPPVNAVNQAMYRELKLLFDAIGERPDVSAVILAGRGRHFCAGHDIDEFLTLTPENNSERMKEVREGFWAIHDCKVPVIAAVHGSALGTGLAIVASCDFAVASEDASLGVPEISVGSMGGARHLARMLPQPLVRKMFFSADPMPAPEVARLGGLVAVVSRERLMDEARAQALRIVRHSPAVLRVAKRGLNAIENMDVKAGYEYEQGLTGELADHPDAKEAAAAFLERRTPSYRRS